ncbi:hypothetical protein ACRRTK_009015 [Alexandromys fortis]
MCQSPCLSPWQFTLPAAPSFMGLSRVPSDPKNSGLSTQQRPPSLPGRFLTSLHPSLRPAPVAVNRV